MTAPPFHRPRGYLRRQPCEAASLGGCSGPIDPAHIRYNDGPGRLNPGGARKNHDRHCNPLCRAHHDEQHSMAERYFWDRLGNDAYETAAAHYAAYQGDHNAGHTRGGYEGEAVVNPNLRGPAFDNLRNALAAQPAGAQGEAVAWLIEWQNKPSEGAKCPGGGSEIIRNQYAAVVGKVKTLEGMSWVETVKVTPLAPLYATPAQPDDVAALREARDAVEFFDRVKAATEEERIAVGHDHWDRLEAAIRAVAALSKPNAPGAR